MKKWKLVTGVVIVFVFGILAGSLGAGFYHKYRFDHIRKDHSAKKALILKKLSGKLDLTESQRDAFKNIIDQIEDRKEEHFRKSRSEFVKIMDQGLSQMKQVLDPDQQKKLDEFMERFRKRIKSRGLIGPHQSQ
ncbi:MAG TPA: hypothetical protein VMW42_08745 [Desulfatiglandales bacterium]|nr:hypothetical protein [Desulfatiglandales bacterium]